MKTIGRLLSKIAFITFVVLIAVALVAVVAVVANGGAAEILEMSCKAFVALASPAVAFSKATVAFPKLLVIFSDNTLVAFVVLVEPLVMFVVVGSLALSTGEAELDSAFSKGKL
jgi:hypothetical protein